MSLLLVAASAIAGCSTSGGGSLTAAQQKYVADVRGNGGVSSSQATDQALVKAGKVVCTALGSGLTMKDLESSFNLKLNSAAKINAQGQIDSVVEGAIYYLCPRFSGQLPKV